MRITNSATEAVQPISIESLEMGDWFRSVSVLGMAFVGVVVLTLGLAAAIVPGTAVSSQGDDGTPSASAIAREPEVTGGIPEVGGTLTVTGDVDGTFRLTRESLDGRYSLVGDQGRISFEGVPTEVAQLSYEGLEFFPAPADCSVAPRELDTTVGVGSAVFRCDDLEDIRGDGVISIEGVIGLPVDMLGERSFPASGGSVEVGGETWQFSEALLFTAPLPAIAGAAYYNLELVDEEAGGALNFTYDHLTHRLTLVNVGRDGQGADTPAGACTLHVRVLGKTNPRTTITELTIHCAAVDVPGLGTVAIDGTVVVDQIDFPA